MVTQKPRRSKKKDTVVPQPSGPTTNVADEAINNEMDDSLVRAATTASSLEAELYYGNIDKTQSKATPNEPSSPGTSSGGGPKRQETTGDTIAQTRSKNVSKLSNDLLLARVLNLETTKTTQATEIASLKRRVKKLERRNKRMHPNGGGIAGYLDANKDIYLVNVQTDEDMFSVTDLDGDEVIVKISVATTTTTEITDVEMTLAQALAKLKSAKPKADKEQAPTPTISSQQSSHFQGSDKGKRQNLKPKTSVKKMSKKELLRLDEELAFKLQAEEEDEMAFELLRLVKNSLRKAMYLNEVFGSIPP
ncbi:hypothetical protein Tco_0273452 [Tanacetum coccineum]